MKISTSFSLGLHGSAMLPWDLTEKQMFQVMSYVKTFAPKTWEGKIKTWRPQYKNISKTPLDWLTDQKPLNVVKGLSRRCSVPELSSSLYLF